MTIFLAPCGVSILGGLRWSRGAPQHTRKEAAGDAVNELLYRLGAPEVADAGMSVLPAWQDAFAEVGDELRLEDWHVRVCAETSTLLARGVQADPRAAVLFEPEDSVVLLASDTVPGLVSALLVATRVTGGDLGAIRYAETPEAAGEAGDYPVQPGAATVVRVRGLDPKADDAFARAAWGTGDVMRAAREMPAAEAIDIQLSGGFKAVLLHTLALAEVLYSQNWTQVAVTACYVYDNDSANPADSLIEVGLRRASEGSVRTMRDELVSVRDGRRLDSAEFEGVAWNRSDGQPRLNAFGHGFLAVLGNPGETSSDATHVR